MLKNTMLIIGAEQFGIDDLYPDTKQLPELSGNTT